MITDSFDNLKQYKEIPPEAIEFMALGGISCGKHILSGKCFINIEEYETKHIQDARYESHRNYIDVQILLSGKEELYYTDIKNLTTDIPYSKEKDIEFYKDPVAGDKVVLDGTNFILLYPQDAHAPQVALNNKPQNVKKAVIKIRV